MVFERFSPESRRAVVLAQEEARKLNHPQIDHEHLLLGILAGESDASAHPGGNLLTYQEVEREILARHPKGDSASNGHIPFVHEAKKVFTRSLQIALEHGHSSIDVEHLTLALLNAKNPLVEAILKELKVNKALVCESLTISAQEKENVRTAPAPALMLEPLRIAASELLKDDSTPRENLTEALRMLVRHMDDEILEEVVAILKK